jgi:hypothetical protein
MSVFGVPPEVHGSASPRHRFPPAGVFQRGWFSGPTPDYLADVTPASASHTASCASPACVVLNVCGCPEIPGFHPSEVAGRPAPGRCRVNPGGCEEHPTTRHAMATVGTIRGSLVEKPTLSRGFLGQALPGWCIPCEPATRNRRAPGFVQQPQSDPRVSHGADQTIGSFRIASIQY